MSILSSKTLAVVLIIFLTLIASHNLSPSSLSSGLPIYHHTSEEIDHVTFATSSRTRSSLNSDSSTSTTTATEKRSTIELGNGDGKFRDADYTAHSEEEDEAEDSKDSGLVISEKKQGSGTSDAAVGKENDGPPGGGGTSSSSSPNQEPQQKREALQTTAPVIQASPPPPQDPQKSKYGDKERDPYSLKDVDPALLKGTDQYHLVMTVGEGLYTEWQSRVSYYWYKKYKKENPGGPMGGFTRLLHTGQGDDFMDEIPTIVVDPLPEELAKIAEGYVVLNRPYGLMQWVNKYLSKIPEKYILMTEPDHLFIDVPPLWATPTKAAAFPFFYIEPAGKENVDIVQRFNPKHTPIEKFFPVGNSPVMISKAQIGPVINLWANLSMEIKQDKDADKKWGWVQEMYAWCIASAQMDPPVEYELHPEFMLQPPWDAQLTSAENHKPAYIIHYTYGNDFNSRGEFVPSKVGKWHFDKRDFMDKYPPLNIPMPPSGCTNEAVKKLILMINEASANIPGWKDKAYPDMKSVPLYWGGEVDKDDDVDGGGDGEKEEKKEEKKEEVGGVNEAATKE